MKKTLLLLALCVFLLGNNSFAMFTDVSEDAWYYDSVRYVAENDILNGIGGNLFAPRDNMTRAMIVQALYNIENTPEVTSENTYEDVESGKWYEKAIVWSSENKLVSGVGENKFAPNTLITKEQMITILYNYAKFKEYDVSVGEDTNILSYNDVNKLAEYAYSPMQWACGSKIVSGYEGNLEPKKNLTRAEVATIIRNFDNAYPRHDLGWVELKGSIAAGYGWSVTSYDSEVVEISTYLYEDPESNLVGQVGIFKFKIRGLKEGQTRVEFNYGRPGEEKLSTVICQVEVNEKNEVQLLHVFE